MIAAICEIVDKKDEYAGKSDQLTADFLEACHFIFETGILSHEMISAMNSLV